MSGEWKQVPVEPTEKMDEAGSDAVFECMTVTSAGDIEYQPEFATRCYRAMLAAAPAHAEAMPAAFVFPEDIRALRSLPQHQAVLYAFGDDDPRGIPMVGLYLAPPPTAAEAALEEALAVLDTYADRSGYVDSEGSPYGEEGDSYPGALAKEAAEKLRAALSSQPPATEGWRPIEECPDDGSPIWLAVRWADGTWNVETRVADHTGFWQTSRFLRKWMPRLEGQPLPAPPARGGDDAE